MSREIVEIVSKAVATINAREVPEELIAPVIRIPRLASKLALS